MAEKFKAGELVWYAQGVPPRGVQMVVCRSFSYGGTLTTITLVNSGETFDTDTAYLFRTKEEAKAYVDQERRKKGQLYSWVVTAERIMLDSEKE